jgi:hypothetical protein
MKFNLLPLMICGAMLLGAAGSTPAQTQLANPSFEEDAGNVGNPDGWEIQKDAGVKVQSGDASDGNRALLVEDGYVAVYQNLQFPKLAGQNLSLSIDAKAVSPGAVFGVRIGYATEDGKWNDAVLLWNKPLTEKYQTYTAARPFPANAKAGRLYLGLYRSDKKSTFLVDNVRLQIGGGLPENEVHRAVVLARDAGYFLNRLEAAAKNETLPQQEQWQAAAQEVMREAQAQNASLTEKFENYEAQIRSLNAELFGVLAKNKPLMVAWAQPFERLAPDALPRAGSTPGTEIMALRGEHCALGFDVAIAAKTPQKISIALSGLPPQSRAMWRRQVFTETWYTKGKTVVADPLTQLASEAGSTLLEIASGEIARLLLDLVVDGSTPAGQYALQITFSQNGKPLETRRATLRVLPQAAPPRRMAHYEFGYTTERPISTSGKEAVRDLVAHGVTDIEWAYMPKAVFDAEGNLQSMDFSQYDKMLQSFAASPIRLNVFWQPSYAKFTTQNGATLEVLSPAWKNAFAQSFAAWLKRAKEKGVSAERITVLIKDEIHSKSLENAPDAGIQEYVAISKFFKEKFPQIKNYLTLSFYAFPADVKAALPYVDVIMPHLPQPEQLTRNAPPTYNPRTAFAGEIYPMLRAKKELQLWSYHVASGRSDDVAAKGPWNRAYPLMAAVTGHTGIAVWAYNAFSGSTWDDTDGSLLDYNFIYDGTENHPINQKWNVTGETIVPSLRWEALRAGLQDADIVLALQETLKDGQLADAQSEKVKELLAQAQKISGSGGTLAESATIIEIENLSQKLREVFSGLSS